MHLTVMSMQTRLSAKGQVVIPKDLRDRLRWTQGEPLEVIETPDGVLLKRLKPGKKLTAKEALAKIRALVKYDGPPVTIEQMNETIAQGWLQSALKSDCAKR
jgi:AbrB family looped-hinge helix DNA binding protein